MGWIIAIGLAAGALLYHLSARSGEPPTAMLILGNSDRGTAIQRIQNARLIEQAYPVSRIVFAGRGPGIDGMPEAQWMASQYGATSAEVIIEDRSGSTHQNVFFSAPSLVGFDVVVVSSHEHAIAAAWCLEHRFGLRAWWSIEPDGIAHRAINDDPQRYCERVGCCDE